MTRTISLTRYVSEAAREGCDQQLRTSAQHHRLLVGGDSIACSADPFRTRLSDADYQALTRAAGFVVTKEPRGTRVARFDTPHDLRAHWDGLRDAA